jgi:hypothetical protein
VQGFSKFRDKSGLGAYRYKVRTGDRRSEVTNIVQDYNLVAPVHHFDRMTATVVAMVSNPVYGKSDARHQVDTSHQGDERR